MFDFHLWRAFDSLKKTAWSLLFNLEHCSGVYRMGKKSVHCCYFVQETPNRSFHNLSFHFFGYDVVHIFHLLK